MANHENVIDVFAMKYQGGVTYGMDEPVISGLYTRYIRNLLPDIIDFTVTPTFSETGLHIKVTALREGVIYQQSAHITNSAENPGVMSGDKLTIHTNLNGFLQFNEVVIASLKKPEIVLRDHFEKHFSGTGVKLGKIDSQIRGKYVEVFVQK